MNRLIEAGISFGIDKPFVINNMVLKAKGEKLMPKRLPKGEVPLHEGIHAALGETKRTTIIPSGNAWGETEPDGEPNPIAAVAPHAVLGPRGTSEDLRIVWAMGYNPDSLIGPARMAAAAKKDEINAIAVGLEDEGTLNASDIQRVIFEYKMPKFETATVSIEDLSGEKQEIRGVEVRDNIVMLPNVWYDVSSNTNKPLIH